MISTLYAYAAEIPELTSIKNNILNPIISFLFALAMVYFLYGLVNFLMKYDDEEAKKAGKNHMIWGIVGLAIMISVYGLTNLLGNTIIELTR